MTSHNDTPMMRQYKEIKEQHRDYILLFRLGDFYEMFFEDAKVASRVLELTLTSRNKNAEGEPVPMCGIPYHALNNYLPRLINKGYKVAICEQTEDPALAKGITRREVVQIVTPGTVTDLSMLDSRQNNYLMAVYEDQSGSDTYGIAYIDVSTGDFYISETSGRDMLYDEIVRVNPTEILLNRELVESFFPTITVYEPEPVDKARNKLCSFFRVNSLESFGCEKMTLAFPAAQAITDYIQQTQKTNLSSVNRITPYLSGRYMFFDAATRRNLEIASTIREKSKTGSLLWVLDKTRTAMGGRLLTQWVASPLLDHGELVARHDSVSELFGNYGLRRELAEQLRNVYDIERLTTRVASGSINPRELRSLSSSLAQVLIIGEKVQHCTTPMINTMLSGESIDTAREIMSLIDAALEDDPPMSMKDGGAIRPGYHQELDDIRMMARDGKAWIAALEATERERTGIKSLKVGYNRVFGYYIEVTNANLGQVPDTYIRKQTLTNGERYITPELKEKESQILTAAERALELETAIYSQIRQQVAAHVRVLQSIAKDISTLDVLASFAEVAEIYGYCRPVMYPQGERAGILRIQKGRHPVIEQTIASSSFIPNDISLDNTDNRFMILTGPNMAGKSTYMRQVALIVLMAQIGSFVPAEVAEISMVDRIFTRVGAMDDIFSGQSTFMVEMNETANILNNATEHSIVILDEIGRGTSTYDGMSIAAAVAEFIHHAVKAKTIFATHYHELTSLASQYQGMNNFSIAVEEEGDHITFLRKVIPGAADKSYGIHVAQLAGLPDRVISRAKELLYGLEEKSVKISVATKESRPVQMELF